MTPASYTPCKQTTAWLYRLAIGGVIVLAIGAMFEPQRVWANLLLVCFYLITLALGGLVLVALSYVTGAGWSVAFRRIPEAMAGIIPLAGIAMLAVVGVGLHDYAWQHHGHGDAGTFWFKELWLEPKFFFARAIGYIVLWLLLGRAIVGLSRRQDQVGGTLLTRTAAGFSALFLLLFAFTFSGASIDWIQALEPMWFSTMWGLYNFSGLMCGAIATVVIMALALRRQGVLQGIFTDDHLHDLGRLLIGFTCFWMYIWFCQYMLVWYSNIPEETFYFIRRTESAWWPLLLANIVLNWIVPFFLLLPRPAKRSERIMMRVAVVVLIGRWLDLYLMIFPPVLDESSKLQAGQVAAPGLGLWEVAAVVALLGVFGLLFNRSFGKANTVPVQDPFLGESLHHHC